MVFTDNIMKCPSLGCIGQTFVILCLGMKAPLFHEVCDGKDKNCPALGEYPKYK